MGVLVFGTRHRKQRHNTTSARHAGFQKCRYDRIHLISIIYFYDDPMFDNQLFEQWLNDQVGQAMKKITQGEVVSPNEIIVLVLKAQTNHITHTYNRTCVAADLAQRHGQAL